MNPMDCIGNVAALLCNAPVMPGEWPSAKIIHVPPGFIQPASAQSTAEWVRICAPRRVINRATGVARLVYDRPGCEYGPDR